MRNFSFSVRLISFSQFSVFFFSIFYFLFFFLSVFSGIFFLIEIVHHYFGPDMKILCFWTSEMKSTKSLKQTSFFRIFFIPFFRLYKIFLFNWFLIPKFDSKVDLPEIKGQHRKFRTLVTSYIGKVGQNTVFGLSNSKIFSIFLNNARFFELFFSIEFFFVAIIWKYPKNKFIFHFYEFLLQHIGS